MFSAAQVTSALFTMAITASHANFNTAGLFSAVVIVSMTAASVQFVAEPQPTTMPRASIVLFPHNYWKRINCIPNESTQLHTPVATNYNLPIIKNTVSIYIAWKKKTDHRFEILLFCVVFTGSLSRVRLLTELIRTRGTASFAAAGADFTARTGETTRRSRWNRTWGWSEAFVAGAQPAAIVLNFSWKLITEVTVFSYNTLIVRAMHRFDAFQRR